MAMGDGWQVQEMVGIVDAQALGKKTDNRSRSLCATLGFPSGRRAQAFLDILWA